MKRNLFSLSCCLGLILAGLFTSCQQEVPEPKPEMVTVIYVSEYGTLAKTEKIVEKGYKLTATDLPSLTQEGYTFDKWYINKKEAKVGAVINKDTVLVAKWNKVLDKIAPKDVTFGEIIAADGKAVINWTIPKDMDSDLKGFELSMNPACGTLTNPVILGSTVKSFSVDGLTNGTPYTFTLKSFDTSMNFSTGVSKDANPVKTEGDKNAPQDPILSVTSVNDGRVVLKWNKVSDSDLKGYKLSSSPNEGTLVNAVTLDKDVLTFTVSELTNGKEYKFTLQSFDNSLNYSVGAIATATPKDTSDKTAPKDVTGLNAKNLNGIIALTWADPIDEDLFGIEIAYTPKSTIISRSIDKMIEESIFIAPKTEYVEITRLVNGTEYTFTLKAMDLSGNKSTGVSVKCTPKNPLSIILTPSTTEKTNKDITVSVNVDDISKVKLIKYAEGTQDVSYFATTGIEVKDNSFTVTKNGTYTVFVQYVDGKREVRTITINNIDKTAPNSLSNFSGSYNAASKKITLNWNEPLDEDYKEVIISDGINNYIVAKNTTTYVLNNVTDDDKVYNFTAIPYDNIGNAGKTVNCSVKALQGPAVTAIELSRNHIAYNDTDKTIDVTIKGSNFDLIEVQNNKSIKVGIWDYSNSLQGTVVYANINVSNNTATATVTIPTLTENLTSEKGEKYTVKAIICGVIAEEAASFMISREAWVKTEPTLSITQIPIEEASRKTTTITFKGVNLDVGVPVTVQLYNSDNKPQGEAVPIAISGKEEQTVTAEIPLPNIEGFFTVKVLFNGVPQEKYRWGAGSWNSSAYINHPTVQIYGAPAFDSFTIPNAGIKKQFANVYGIVKGRNFKAPGVTASNFNLNCNEASITNGYKVEILDDATLKVTLIIPVNANTYTVNIASGNNKCNGVFIVKDYTGYNIGDVLLNDGSKIPYSGITEIDKAKAVAIVCGSNQYGAALGVGLKQSERRLEWAYTSTTGYTTNFTDIICTPSKTGKGAADTATFTRDMDGSDNWSVICVADPTDTKDATTNYPAFGWVNNYGTSLPNGYKDGWYMPSIAELTELYKNKDKVNAALNVVGGNALKDAYYWSSSQVYYIDSLAWMLDFSDGNIFDEKYSYTKNHNNLVCCVRAF